MLHALDAFARFCKTFYRRQLRTKSSSKFVETHFQALSTCSQERRGTNDFQLHLYRTLKTGNSTENNKKQVNNAHRTASELLGHFLNNIRLVFRSNTSSTKYSLKQKRSNVQENNDVTSRVSVPFLPLQCTVTLEGFREVIGSLRALNFFYFLTVEKEKSPHKFPFNYSFEISLT